MGTSSSRMRLKKSKGTTKITDLTRIIEILKKQQTKEQNTLPAERCNILRNALAYFKGDDVEYNPLHITLETSGVEEKTMDLGGPTREFFTLFFKEILRKEVDMFEGQAQGRSLFPVDNERALSGNWFVLGKAIVISVISCGPGFPYFAPCVLSYIGGQVYEHQLNIGMVYNTIMRQLIKRKNNAENEEQLDAALESDSEHFLDNCGWPRYQMITMANRLELTQTLLKWELIGKRATALDQLKKRLNVLGFLEKTANVEGADNLLLETNSEKATADYLKSSLKKQLEKLKTRNDEEEKAKGFTLNCMDMMTDAEATSLFHFITRMSTLLVEDIPIEVEFDFNKTAQLPGSITCIQKLRIPLGNESQMNFFSSFHKALTMGKYGFNGPDE